MKIKRGYIISIVILGIILFSFSDAGSAGNVVKSKFPKNISIASPDQFISSPIFWVYVEDFLYSDGVGTYTIRTGESHPYPIQEVFWSTPPVGGDAGTSYNTIRVYNSSTEYVQTTQLPIPSTGFARDELDNYITQYPTVDGNSIITRWTTPENLNITQIVEIIGTTENDSAVRITTQIRNDNLSAQQVGVRYEWDIAIAGNDSSWFRTKDPVSPYTDVFGAYTPPAFDYYEVINDPSDPQFSVLGSVSEPLFFPLPTRPDSLIYASWGPAFNAAFDYTPSGSGEDSAILYYWDPITIPSGESANLTAYVTEMLMNISGYKNDTQGTGLPGWNITLYNATTGTYLTNNITDSSGFYEFQNLAPGTYNLTEILLNHWINVTAVSQNVTISTGDMTNQNFTNQQLYNISGYKNDTQGNPLSGWNITLYNSTTDAYINNSITDGTGFYEFQNLEPGIYNVTEVMQNGWTNVTPISLIVTISTGDLANQNFTNQQLYNISGYKNDTQGTGLSGWNITLYNSTTDAFINSSITDGSGFYEFQDLVPGEYNITEVMQNGWTNVTPISLIVTITSADETVNFTNQQLYNISGYKNDTQGNLLSGWNITLYNSTTDAYINNSITDGSGFYEFQDLVPGEYNITEVMQPGWTNVTAASQNVTITDSDVVGVNFTNQQQLYNISGYKNDTQDNLLSGWNITLYNASSGDYLNNSITDGSGFYEFQNLAPGIYNVTEVMQSGWTNVTPISQIVTISTGDLTNQNFTNQQLYNISGYKNDTQGNPLSGWNITLYNSTTDAYINNSITNGTGFYEFQNLAPGEYNITEVMQSGWTNVTPISQIVTISTGDRTNINFTNTIVKILPNVTNASANPATILNDNGRARAPGTNITTINVTVTSNATIASVTINLTSIGGLANAPMTPIGGNVYSITTNATNGINLTNSLVVNATDVNGNSSTSVSVQLTVLRRGDIVRDNAVTGADALFIRRYVVGLEILTPSQLFVGDVTPATSAGIITGADALYTRQFVVGLVPAP